VNRPRWASRSTWRWEAGRSCFVENLVAGWGGRKSRKERRTGGVGRRGWGWTGSGLSCCRCFGAVARFLRSTLMMIALRPGIGPNQEHSCSPSSRCLPRSEPPFVSQSLDCGTFLASPSRSPALTACPGTVGTRGSGSWSVGGSVA